MGFLIKKNKISCASCNNEYFSIPFAGLKRFFCPFCNNVHKNER
ncbi:MAG TPA: hypothetical protein VJI98_00890 [Candidatus Nanoarchaeia archaeon]|nr:hypothetical protein [Candidatus Nanoarchaeia archaeon]